MFKYRKPIAILAALGIMVMVFIAVVGCKSTTSTATPPTPTQSAPVTPTQAPPAQAPTQAPPAPSTPSMTASQQQAVTSAQGYLTDGEGFSEEGLLKQLTSSYGDGFDTADAQFAINYINPDWDAQAVESAQGYLDDGEGFSKTSLLQQLTSSYGEGFTQAQATYAVDKVMP